MAIFLVQARGGIERARFIPDRFSWGACLLGAPWLLFRRLWLASLLWVAAEAAFVVFALPRVGPAAGIAVGLLARVWLGFEAHVLRVAKGQRRAELTEVVEGRDRDGAEAAFFGAPGRLGPGPDAERA